MRSETGSEGPRGTSPGRSAPPRPDPRCRSDAGSITFVSGSVKRDTRSTGLVWLLVGQPALFLLNVTGSTATPRSPRSEFEQTFEPSVGAAAPSSVPP